MENRDLFVECKAASLRVCDTAVSAEDQVLVSGDFTAGVKADEAAWALVGDKQTGGQRVVIVVEKQKPTEVKAQHWRSVFKGHPLLDPRTLHKNAILGKLDI